MHIYESKIWKLVPQFFICPGKKLNSVFSWLHLAKNKAWAAPLIIIFLNLFIYFFLASPCEKHGVGGAPVLLVSGRLEMFLNVHTIVLHRSESFTKVEQTKPHRPHERWTGNPFEIWRQVCTRQICLVGWLTLEYWLTVCAIGPQVFPSRAVLLPWLNRWVVSRFGFGSENFRFGFGSGDSRQDLSVSPPGQSWAVQSKTEKCCSLLKLVNVWRRKNNTLSRIRPPGRWKTSRASPLKRK